MSRQNILQISVSADERAFVEARARAEGSSVSGWLRRRVFAAGNPISRAIACDSLDDAYARVADFEAQKLHVDAWPWSLLILREHQGRDSVVCEFFTNDMQPATALRHTPETRFIVGGSPWPYKILENYSWSAGTGSHVVLRLTNERDQNLWAPRKKAG